MHSLVFPIPVLAETGPEVAMTVYRKDLLTLIELEAVIGIGSWKRIKHFRMNRPIEAITNLRVKLKVNPSAEDNKTTFLDGQTQSHNRARSNAYSPLSKLGLA